MGGPQASHSPPTSGGVMDAHPLRVMVVDDHPEFRESLQILLATGGFHVVGAAGDGIEALRLAERLEPDVVLMDVRMPSMDGIEATRRMKSSLPDTMIVALTAQEDQGVVRDMLVAGASCYVLKDSEGEDILNAVQQAAVGGAVLSPGVTPSVIDELIDVLARERRRARELEEANEALIERVARRHELVTRLGHELRTPVTVILGVAGTLAEGRAPSEDMPSLLDSLVNRARALARLVERFEAAVDTDAAQLVDLPELAREVSGSLDRVRVEAEPLPIASVNAVLARRILEELVDNACRFSEPPSPVTVRLGRRFDRIEVRVADRGPGIPPGDRERIFEPLEQVEALDARQHQGAGVGLPLARAAARAMEGDLVLEESSPGGSTFLWTVPVRQDPGTPRS
ncbi:MAG: response regulator [Actinobacteria bacterium]|nr:response regulator [Actinomycetota bacterium]